MLSADRRSHWAHLIADHLWESDLVDYRNEATALLLAKKSIDQFCQQEEEIKVFAEKRIRSLKREIPFGSPEWEVLFNKYCEEERKRKNLL